MNGAGERDAHGTNRWSHSASLNVRAALTDALAQPDRGVRRLRHALTSVRFVAGDEAVTLLLDRWPPLAAAGAEPAEIEIILDTDQARQFAAGQLPMPAAVLTGAVAYTGALPHENRDTAVPRWPHLPEVCVRIKRTDRGGRGQLARRVSWRSSMEQFS